MPQSEYRKSDTFDRPRHYRIRVQGFLDESWSERLGGMTITTSSTGDRKPLTTLTGLMVDQADLAGVLKTLYELHLALMSVEPMNEE